METQVLLEIARTYYASGDLLGAKARLDHIVQEYPEAEEIPQARELIETIEAEQLRLVTLEAEEKEAAERAQRERIQEQRRREETLRQGRARIMTALRTGGPFTGGAVEGSHWRNTLSVRFDSYDEESGRVVGAVTFVEAGATVKIVGRLSDETLSVQATEYIRSGPIQLHGIYTFKPSREDTTMMEGRWVNGPRSGRMWFSVK